MICVRQRKSTPAGLSSLGQFKLLDPDTMGLILGIFRHSTIVEKNIPGNN